MEQAVYSLLKNDRLRVTLCSLGAAIARVELLMPDGSFRTVSLSPAAFAEQRHEPSLTGRCVAPCCGRVRGAEICFQGQSLPLTPNEGSNQLHGGPHGAAWQVWQQGDASDETAAFSLILPDGLDGWPGNRRVRVCYRLTGLSLQMDWSVLSDRDTFFDLTNHVYWDLTGRFDGSALQQRLCIPADRAVMNDEAHLPLRILPVDGTPFDFRAGASFEENMTRFPGDAQLSTGRGYNHAFLTQGRAITLTAPDHSLRLTQTQSRPASVLYSGGFLDAQTMLESGPAVPSCAVALEAQCIPDAFHLEGIEPEWLQAGQAMAHWIRWDFDFPEGSHGAAQQP